MLGSAYTRVYTAAILSIKLNLQPDLDLEQMCAPLLLLDRFNLLEAYVSGHPELQSQLLQMLDRWSDSSFNLRKLSKEYVGIPPVKPDKLNLKTLSKLAFRLLETNNLDPALCTNIINQRHLGTLKYLMYKRFVERFRAVFPWKFRIVGTAGFVFHRVTLYCTPHGKRLRIRSGKSAADPQQKPHRVNVA
ncbi:unnamed protein product [Ranitomeya imitator]|uniref:Uncharacterized protein n=1 Tax=Ranitomeya imitator TaxID=111125 RepID=A0ABN9LE78_9NEOB|nr:unnamed protein product [Ranitomeya imitator]